MELLPKGWLWVRHDEIAEINPKLPEDGYSPNLMVSFIPMRSVEEETGKLDLSEEREYYQVKKGYTPFIEGDLIFAKITPCMENGKLAILDGLRNGIGFGSTEFHVSRLTKYTNVKYLYYYFLRKAFRRDAQQNMTGSAGQLRVPNKYFQRVLIPLPPLPEQHRIVAKIEELFSNLDQGIEQLKTAQQQLKVYRQAVLKWAFEGKLTEKWRKTHHVEPAERLLEQIKTERENRYQQQLEEWKKAVKEWETNGNQGKKPVKPQKPKGFTPLSEKELAELPQLPDGWCWVKLGNACGKIFDGTHFSPQNYPEGRYKYITAKNIKEHGIDLSDITYVTEDDHKEIYARCDVKKGDVLYIKDGATTGIATVNNWDEEFSLLSSVGVFRTFHNLIEPKYLSFYLNSKVTRNRMLKNIAGVAITRLTLVKLNNSVCSLASIQEQHQIVQEIETRLSVCDNIEANIEEALQKAEALRQNILKKSFEGKLVLQDPNDEPASVLLERIKAEKAKQKAQEAEKRNPNNKKKEKAL
ncbi:MAG: restriction endonuclease subunit S [bacterium]